MQAIAAYSTLALTLGLVVARPRIGRRFRLDPAVSAALGVVSLLVWGVVHPSQLTSAADVLWRPLAGIVAIMITTAAAQRIGALDAVAALTIARVRGSAARLFAAVFAVSAATSAVLNNDAAVLLLTPIVVVLVRRRFPAQPRVVVAFAFAVFMAAGVAPLVVSNPMNMVVASYAGIGFNEYARTMLPVAVAGWIVSFGVLRLVFARTLASATARDDDAPNVRIDSLQASMLALLVAVVGAYPIVSLLGGPIWIVSACGAVLALALASRRQDVSPASILAKDVSWGIVFFLTSVFVIGIGLRNVGLVHHIARVYAGGNVATIGGVSALGSAVLNNHPMAILNMLALDETSDAGRHAVLAALVGGDLGPRLLPMGSLAGLLWLESLRRAGVGVSVGRFVVIGALVTIPSIVVSLLVLG